MAGQINLKMYIDFQLTYMMYMKKKPLMLAMK